MDLSVPPEPLDRRQRTIFWILAAVCALSRFAALARSQWDWDETLFSLGMRDYDVQMHHPHPPGFPVYIAIARLVRLVVHNDFRALQAINIVAALLVFPAVFLLARELRMRFETSVIAGVLFAFFPNVWFFGGGAFSDVPSIVLAVFAAALLLRGVRSRRDYLLGTLLLALAAGIRPQNLLVGLFPGVMSTFKRSWRDVVLALLIGVVIVGSAYGGAAMATGRLEDYMSAIRHHRDYISRVDSFRNPDRPPLWRIADRFFLKQYQSPPLSALTSIFVFVSIAGAIRNRDRRVLYGVLTFAPVAIMAWLMLDRHSISRFSIGYQPMFALLAADGIARAARGRERSEWAIAAALIAAFVIYTAPALTPVRNEISPPVKAVEAVKGRLDPKRDHLFVAYGMMPFMEYFAPSFPMTRVMDDRALPLTPAERPFLLAEGDTGGEALRFTRERGRLWNIARRHYFEVFLKPVDRLPTFVTGWYPPFRDIVDEFRWMGAHSMTGLPPTQAPAVLRFIFNVPRDLLGANVTVTLNGKVLERIHLATDEIARDYHVDTLATSPNTLEFAIDRTIEQDGRQVGLRLRFLSLGRD